jgi:hypothetical protein
METIGCLETPETTNLRCLTLQKSENLIINVKVIRKKCVPWENERFLKIKVCVTCICTSDLKNKTNKKITELIQKLPGKKCTVLQDSVLVSDIRRQLRRCEFSRSVERNFMTPDLANLFNLLTAQYNKCSGKYRLGYE